MQFGGHVWPTWALAHACKEEQSRDTHLHSPLPQDLPWAGLQGRKAWRMVTDSENIHIYSIQCSEIYTAGPPV